MNEIMKTGPWTVVIQKGLQSSLFCQHCYSTYCIHDRHSSSTVCILIHLTFTRTLEVRDYSNRMLQMRQLKRMIDSLFTFAQLWLVEMDLNLRHLF